MPPHMLDNKELLLQVNDLECTRDDRLLFSGLSFAVSKGEVLQIEGSNGSGKTSLLRILCGLRVADDGVVNWRGSDITKEREDYYSNMVYIGHLTCIKAELTTLENIRSLLDTRSLSASDDEIIAGLTRVGLAAYDDVPSKALSSGQKRRVLLAFLLLSETILWILDEPLTALDVNGVALMEAMIIEHQQQGGSVIFTTHHGMKLPCEMGSVQLGKAG